MILVAFRTRIEFALCVLLFLATIVAAQQPPAASAPDRPFRWPEGKRAAVSLSFDDARASQIDVGLPLLKKWREKVTFFITPGAAEKRLAGWKQAIADGHEIANHSLTHPCTANYAFSSHNALEDYDLRSMAQQLDEANDRIEKLLGVRPTTFAYPCGLKFVGRGLDVRSYVPLVAERFIVGRGYLDESPNDPAVTDLAQAMGTPFDAVDFTVMKSVVDAAAKEGRWVIFVGHDIGDRGHQSTDATALERLFALAGTTCQHLVAVPPDKLSVGGGRELIPHGVRQQGWRRDGGRCVRCGAEANLHFDTRTARHDRCKLPGQTGS